jgi:hypothetical protein
MLIHNHSLAVLAGDSAPPFVGEELSTKRFVRSISAGDKGADPYLSTKVSKPSSLQTAHQLRKSKTHQAITAIPKNAEMQLNTNATIPRAVKPSGRGGTDMFSPLRSKTSLMLPAALPW